MQKKKLWNEMEFRNWLYNDVRKDSTIHDTASKNIPSLYPCIVVWNSGSLYQLGCYSFVYFNEF